METRLGAVFCKKFRGRILKDFFLRKAFVIRTSNIRSLELNLHLHRCTYRVHFLLFSMSLDLCKFSDVWKI